MEDNNDEQFSRWLETREFHPCRADLAASIIQASARMQQKTAFSLAVWLRNGFAEYVAFKPAYMLISLLLISFLLGFSSFSTALPDEEDYASNTQISFYDDGSIL